MFASMFLILAMAAVKDEIPPYFIKLIQDRTLFARDEPVILKIRLGNQTQRALKTRKFPDILAGLTVARGEVTLKMSDKFSSAVFYRRQSSLGYGAHRDFRLNLLKYFPDMREGGVYKVTYQDAHYTLEGNNISITSVSLPDLNADYVVRTSLGSFTIKLEPEQAPHHAKNFALLTATRFYQDLIFHRVEKGLVIQTGDPLGTGQSGSGFPLNLEISPFLKHRKYAVGMARATDPNSATSQFYVCLDDVKELDGQYTVFGKVIEGYDVIDAIAATPTTGPSGSPPNRPLTDVNLISIDIRP